ncbi:polysulfide reductase NrfD [Aeromonas rivipollensis]|uniref:NrfD/PsrC family molybdoenzyme membrane anchor subunit n=1 Tax=Aeromonas rivipollensis TaxID=948519 RepID=UPI00259EA491|nr:NrfD/PsrC family molybdoenzyme membrane anchor subunit [Aeromonas rivipollensis]MDM5084678.1 polysulfide reductase NrfD [Aeromonas rivipollensis]MDM5096749.1 polysulfide reductase NrfD [Aeromonas rivipollensis]MDM5105024.1 polysulfide reductase NrfD [Aeromonas rivipollensis]
MTINELLAPDQPITWLPWAVQYFFLIGLAYGALWLGAADLWRKAPDRRLQTLAAVLMMGAGVVAPIALTADLHQPARAWHFYAQTRFGSIMWYGAYLLPLFSLLSMLFGWLLIRPNLARRGEERDRVAALARLLCLGHWPSEPWLKPLALMAALSGLSIALYTGLETMAVAARPLWHTPWLPWLLVLSALLAAQSALLLLNRLLTGWQGRTEADLLRQIRPTLALLTLSLLGWALFGGASAAEASALYRLDPSWRLAAHWLLLTLGLLGLLLLAGHRFSPRLQAWGLGLLALHLVWGLRWLVLIQGQLAPKYGAGVYVYQIAWGPAGMLGILGTFGLLLALLVALSELVRAPALPSATTSSATQASTTHSAREAI